MNTTFSNNIKEEEINKNLFNKKNELLNTKNDLIIHQYINFTNGFILGLIIFTILFYVFVMIPKSKPIVQLSEKPPIFKSFQKLCGTVNEDYNTLYEKLYKYRIEKEEFLKKIAKLNIKSTKELETINQKEKNIINELIEIERCVIDALLRIITNKSEIKDITFSPDLYEYYKKNFNHTLLEWIFYELPTFNKFISDIVEPNSISYVKSQLV